MRRVAASVLLLALYNLLVACRAPAGPTPTSRQASAAAPIGGGTGRIALLVKGETGLDIYTMTVDGLDLTRLTSTDAWDTNPQWSPDGKRLAFGSGLKGPGPMDLDEIYIINADGTGLTRLTHNDTGDWAPAWSPDGRLIAFSSKREDNVDIYFLTAEGAERRVTESLDEEESPAWQP